MLIKDAKVPVQDDKGNVITIRAKMNMQVKALVQDAAYKATFDGRAPTATIGAYRVALLEHNILGWNGPDFTDPETGKVYPCTAESIHQLDDDEPLIAKVLEEIGKRNKSLFSASPNASESTSSGDAG